MACDKKAFTKTDAEAAVATANFLRRERGKESRAENRVYFCLECDTFHLTSQAPPTRKKRPAPYKRTKAKYRP